MIHSKYVSIQITEFKQVSRLRLGGLVVDRNGSLGSEHTHS